MAELEATLPEERYQALKQKIVGDQDVTLTTVPHGACYATYTRRIARRRRPRTKKAAEQVKPVKPEVRSNVERV
jgi:hypothetical protein